MSKIKICGLKREEDIRFVNITKPDYVGFVFAGIKRKIDFNTASKLKFLLDNKIQSVGVFVNEPIDSISGLCDDKIIDLVQLHGNEDDVYVSKLKENIKLPIIKAVRVKSKLYNVIVKTDFILFDAYNDLEYGGSGKVFNWDLVKGYKEPFFLAGGLNKDNVKEVVQKINPYCVDLSSGVETNGIKDFEKIKIVIEIVRKESK